MSAAAMAITAGACSVQTPSACLDVGCGNGYHCWRMLGADAERVIGIDPSAKFVFQFYAIKRFAGNHLPIDVLPLGIEHMPEKMAAFDTVFSMGILYHRRSPMDHLRELRQLLKPGGQLVLETLVIEGAEDQLLVPQDRYAKMPNVWFIPSPDMLLSWMSKNGLKNPRMVDISTTTIEEQRSTDWMKFESLADFWTPMIRVKLSRVIRRQCEPSLLLRHLIKSVLHLVETLCLSGSLIRESPLGKPH